MAFSDIFSEQCFEHAANKIMFLFLKKWKIILINFEICSQSKLILFSM